MGREKGTASPDAHLSNEETTETPSDHPEVTEEAGILPSACPWQVRCCPERFDA